MIDDDVHDRLVQLEATVEDQRGAVHALEIACARYANLFDYAPVASVVLDRTGVIRVVALNAVAFLRAPSREMLLGRALASVVDASPPGVIRDHIAQCLEARGRVVSDATFRLGGRETPVQLIGVPLHDPEGQELVATTLHDLSDRKRTEDVLRFLGDAGRRLGRSLDRDTIAADVAHLSVPRLADLCLVDLVEDGAWRRAGCEHRDASWSALLRRDGDQPGHALLPRLREATRELFTSGSPQVVSLEGELDNALLSPERRRNLRRLGVREALLLTIGDPMRGVLTLIQCESGRRFQPADVALARELAAAAAAALENAQLHLELKLANRAKDAFLATISHELRTPLGGTLNWLEALRRGPGDPALLARALDGIEACTRMQSRLVEDLVDLVRGLAGRLALSLGPVDLRQVVPRAIDTMSGDAQRRGLVIDASFDAAQAAVWGDPQRIEQIVANLLSNAVKYSRDGGRVAVRVIRDGDDVKLVVSDAGRGIAADRLEKVFEPFWRGLEDEHPQAGLGLGLAIARQLARLQGGDVLAASPGDGAGATFTVILPALVVTPPPADRDGPRSG